MWREEWDEPPRSTRGTGFGSYALHDTKVADGSPRVFPSDTMHTATSEGYRQEQGSLSPVCVFLAGLLESKKK